MVVTPSTHTRLISAASVANSRRLRRFCRFLRFVRAEPMAIPT